MSRTGPKKDLSLIPRNMEILRLRFIHNWTLQRIGDKYQITKERVRQIINENGDGNGEKK